MANESEFVESPTHYPVGVAWFTVVGHFETLEAAKVTPAQAVTDCAKHMLTWAHGLIFERVPGLP